MLLEDMCVNIDCEEAPHAATLQRLQLAQPSKTSHAIGNTAGARGTQCLFPNVTPRKQTKTHPRTHLNFVAPAFMSLGFSNATLMRSTGM